MTPDLGPDGPNPAPKADDAPAATPGAAPPVREGPDNWYTKDGRLRGSLEPMPGRCGGKLWRTDPPRYCRRPPLPGRTRCKTHGGTKQHGASHPNFRGAGISRDLPIRLREEFEETLRDPELLSMREHAAALRMRVKQLARRLDTGEEGGLWAALKTAFAEFRRANREAMEAAQRNDPDAAAAKQAQMAAALGRVGNLIDRGASNELVWDQLGSAMKKEADVAAREWKRLAEMGKLLTAEQGMALITALAMSVQRHVRDQEARRCIADDMSRLVNLGRTIQAPRDPG
jgi:G:T/U-mismatch repair DNA glycosylase